MSDSVPGLMICSAKMIRVLQKHPLLCEKGTPRPEPVEVVSPLPDWVDDDEQIVMVNGEMWLASEYFDR